MNKASSRASVLGERVEHFETARRSKDGSIINISLTVSPIKGSDGQIIGAPKLHVT
jgi:hypothetical protein